MGTIETSKGKEVIFRSKSAGQKDNCLFCNNRRATLEAVYGIARIRCCDKNKCKQSAAEVAKEQGG